MHDGSRWWPSPNEETWQPLANLEPSVAARHLQEIAGGATIGDRFAGRPDAPHEIGEDLVEGILAACTRDDDGYLVMKEVDFSHTSFPQSLELGPASTFGGHGPVRFQGGASFRSASLLRLNLVGCEVQGDLDLTAVNVRSYGDFRNIRIHGSVVAEYMRVERIAGFGGMVVGKDANFGGSEVGENFALWPISVAGAVNLTSVDFVERAGIRVCSGSIDLSACTFDKGGTVELVGRHDPVADSEDISWLWGPTTPASELVAGPPHEVERAIIDLSHIRTDDRLEITVSDGASGQSSKPDLTLRSLEGARLDSPLIIAPVVDLSSCSFQRASGLSHLRLLGGTTRFARLGSRRAIADEFSQRTVGRPSSAEVEATYRQLRGALEESNAYAAAGDFFYGEMEMRRSSATSNLRDLRTASGREAWRQAGAVISEAGILWAHWLTSGYGLRASRAVAAWFTIVAVAAALMIQGSFDPAGIGADETYWSAMEFSFRSSISFLNPPDAPGLTGPDFWAQAAVRLTGPALIGLAVVAIRARVRR